MQAVIFEVWPHPDYKDNYLELASAMRKELEQIDGFISVERFESLTEPGKLLSLSFWRDAEALNQWRQLHKHRQMQKLGRETHFTDYRLRVAVVVRDYGLNEREQAPDDSKALHG